jgi:excisionase family DNA binding protein
VARSEEVDVVAAAAIAGRSAETVRRWVWSGRLRAHKRGNKLLISRADLERLLRSDGGASRPTLAEWLNEVQQSGLKAAATAASAADLVLMDRRARSEEA